MALRENFASSNPWEDVAAYSRVVKVGNTLYVAGTTAGPFENAGLKGDAKLQTKFVLNKIKSELENAGASIEDVVRTRMFVVDIKKNSFDVAEAHADVFRKVKPAVSMVGVTALIEPDLLVEIEVDAVITSH